MNAFAAVAADIRAERTDAADKERALLKRLSADIERFDPKSQIGTAAECACNWIRRGGDMSDADVCAIACALYREIAKSSHIERNRTAMACLVDIAADFAASTESDDDVDTDRIQDAQRDARLA